MVKLAVYDKPIDIERFSGTWYVNRVKPTYFETSAYNPEETYTFAKGANNGKVLFKFNDGSNAGKVKTMSQLIYTNNKDGNWSVSPITWMPCFKLSYSVLDIQSTDSNDKESPYNYIIVVHKNKYAWVMSRSRQLSNEKTEEALVLLEKNGFNRKDLIAPSQDPKSAFKKH